MREVKQCCSEGGRRRGARVEMKPLNWAPKFSINFHGIENEIPNHSSYKVGEGPEHCCRQHEQMSPMWVLTEISRKLITPPLNLLETKQNRPSYCCALEFHGNEWA